MDFEWFCRIPDHEVDMNVGDWGRDALMGRYHHITSKINSVNWNRFVPVAFYDSEIHRARTTTCFVVTRTVSGSDIVTNAVMYPPMIFGSGRVLLGIRNQFFVKDIEGSLTVGGTSVHFGEMDRLEEASGYCYFVLPVSGLVKMEYTFRSTGGVPHHFAVFLAPIDEATRDFYRRLSRAVSQHRFRSADRRQPLPYRLVSDWEQTTDVIAGETPIFWGQHVPRLAAFDPHVLAPIPTYGLQIRRRTEMQRIDLKNMTIEIRPVTSYRGRYPAGGYPLVTELGPEWQIVNAQIQPLNGNVNRFYTVDLANRKVRVFTIAANGSLSEVATGTDLAGETVYQVLTAIPVTSPV